MPRIRAHSPFRRRVRPVAVCLPLLVACVAQAEPPWEYRFEVGDRLVYERQTTVSELTGDKTLRRHVDQIQIWCLEKQRNETLILLDLIRIVGDRVEPVRGIVLHLDDRGRRRMPPVTQRRAPELHTAFDVVPVLPLPMQQPPQWQTPPDLLGLRRRCTLIGPDDQRGGQSRVEYVVEYPHDIDDVFPRSHIGRYWFDPRAGYVTRVESLRQDRAADRCYRAVTVLRRRDRQPPAWIQRRAAESQRYLQTLQHEDYLLDDVVRRPQQLEQTLERLARLWAGRAVDFERHAESPFTLLVRARPRHLAAEVPWLRAIARYAQQRLGQPAAGWSLQTATGETLTSEQVRAGVVIECLWSFASPGFPATLAELRGLQEQLADRPVRVIYLNMDSDVHLARRVIECFPPGMTHVLAGPLRAVDDPPALPVVRILDDRGVVSRLWIGWQASYAEVLSEARRLSD